MKMIIKPTKDYLRHKKHISLVENLPKQKKNLAFPFLLWTVSGELADVLLFLLKYESTHAITKYTSQF